MASQTIDRVPETDLRPTNARTRSRAKRPSAGKHADAAMVKGNETAALLLPADATAVRGKKQPVELKTVPMGNFFGIQRARPFIKLDENNKVVKDESGSTQQLPNAALLGWSAKNNYKRGGLKGAPKPATRVGDEEDSKAPWPSRVRRAWEFYADELLKKALESNPDAKQFDEVSVVRRAVREEVLPTIHRGRARRAAVVAAQGGDEREAAPVGKWQLLTKEQRVPYVDMWEADRERYRSQLKAYWDAHPEEVRDKAAAVSARKEARKQRKQQQQVGNKRGRKPAQASAGGSGDGAAGAEKRAKPSAKAEPAKGGKKKTTNKKAAEEHEQQQQEEEEHADEEQQHSGGEDADLQITGETDRETDSEEDDDMSTGTQTDSDDDYLGIDDEEVIPAKKIRGAPAAAAPKPAAKPAPASRGGKRAAAATKAGDAVGAPAPAAASTKEQPSTGAAEPAARKGRGKAASATAAAATGGVQHEDNTDADVAVDKVAQKGSSKRGHDAQAAATSTAAASKASKKGKGAAAATDAEGPHGAQQGSEQAMEVDELAPAAAASRGRGISKGKQVARVGQAGNGKLVARAGSMLKGGADGAPEAAAAAQPAHAQAEDTDAEDEQANTKPVKKQPAGKWGKKAAPEPAANAEGDQQQQQGDDAANGKLPAAAAAGVGRKTASKRKAAEEQAAAAKAAVAPDAEEPPAKRTTRRR